MSSIIAIQVIVWLLMFLQTSIGITAYNLGIGSNFAISQGEYWRFVTPIFLHDWQGIGHLLFNSFALILFGPALEHMLGKLKFIMVYLGSGIAGNIFTYLVDTELTQFHLGASGAIYGLLGLLIYMVYFTPKWVDPASRQIIFVFVVIGLIMTFLRPGINEAAHLFGFIGGFAFGPLVTMNMTPYYIRRSVRKPRKTAGGVQFDPNRWNKKRFRVSRNTSSIIWWIILILAVLGILSGIVL
ncbi:rhomboid family intramembrane serine protease [Pelagirhabdus alkalitolerans]|uniref:rhomboid family intramembrane serine protease n=1 Tax=Pelagirhabdus alkalitolerans TaxID=1612202 RepID=UPI0031836EBA